MNIETKCLGGRLTKAHEEERNGVKVGIISGYGATFDIDRGDMWGVKDQFVKGAFLDSINDHKQRARQIRFQNQHNNLVGGFPIDKVYEDGNGIFIEGEINLEIQEGREMYSLAKQDVLTDFSIGFSVDKYEMDEKEEIRTITKATIWEFSLVREPANPNAQVTSVKSISEFTDLPIANKDREWNGVEAIKHVNETKTQDNAYIIRKGSDYSLLIADNIGGNLVVFPDALINAAEEVKNLDDKDKVNAIKHLERYFAKASMTSPFVGEEKQFYTVDNVKEFDSTECSKAMLKAGVFTKGAVEHIVKSMQFEEKQAIIEVDSNANQNILDELLKIKSLVSK